VFLAKNKLKELHSLALMKPYINKLHTSTEVAVYNKQTQVSRENSIVSNFVGIY